MKTNLNSLELVNSGLGDVLFPNHKTAPKTNKPLYTKLLKWFLSSKVTVIKKYFNYSTDEINDIKKAIKKYPNDIYKAIATPTNDTNLRQYFVFATGTMQQAINRKQLIAQQVQQIPAKVAVQQVGNQQVDDTSMYFQESNQSLYIDGVRYAVDVTKTHDEIDFMLIDPKTLDEVFSMILLTDDYSFVDGSGDLFTTELGEKIMNTDGFWDSLEWDFANYEESEEYGDVQQSSDDNQYDENGFLVLDDSDETIILGDGAITATSVQSESEIIVDFKPVKGPKIKLLYNYDIDTDELSYVSDSDDEVVYENYPTTFNGLSLLVNNDGKFAPIQQQVIPSDVVVTGGNWNYTEGVYQETYKFKFDHLAGTLLELTELNDTVIYSKGRIRRGYADTVTKEFIQSVENEINIELISSNSSNIPTAEGVLAIINK